MKKLLAALAIVVVVIAGAGGWYVWLRPHDRLALARSLMTKGDARGAQLSLRGVVMDDPGNAEAHFRLGEVQLRLGDPVAAERELNEARQRGWDPHAVEPQLADAVLAQRRYADVLASFKTDGLTPDQASAVLVARSNAALALHEPGAARADAAQAETLAPKAIGPAIASAAAAAASHDGTAAAAAIGRALAIDPRSSTALMMQADLQRAHGDEAGMLASLDAAVAAAPAQPGPRLARAQALLAARQADRARADVAVLLKQDPRGPLANYLNAQLLARARDFAGADVALQAVGPALDQIPRGDMLLAVVKANLKQPGQAADAAARYLGRAPGDPEAYKLVASLALSAGRDGDAADALDRAVASGHADAETYDLLGQADARLGHGPAALAAMSRAASLAPSNPAILSRLAALRLGAGDPSRAALDLQHLLDMQPAAAAPVPVPVKDAGAAPGVVPPPPVAPSGALSPSQTASELVVASLQSGQTDRAAAALERLRTMGGDPARIDSLTGLLKMGQLDFAGAQAAFEAAVERDPKAAAAQVNLAGVLALRGEQDQAEALLRRVLARDPGNLGALSALQRLLLGSGRNDAAVAALQAAVAADKTSPVLTAALADLYDHVGQPAAALALLDAAPAQTAAGAKDAAPNGGQILLAARVRAQLAAGKRRDAAESLRKLVALRPADLGLRRQLIGVLAADHDTAGAQAAVDAGLAAQPGNPALLADAVSVAAQAGGLQAGLDRANALAQDPANLPAARLLKGDLYMTTKHYAQAASAFAAELHESAASTTAIAAALANQAAGDPDRAAGILRDWLATHPDATDVASALAVLDIGAKRLDAARTNLQLVLSKQPNDPAALNNLAWIDQQQHQPEQARTLAQRSWLLSATPQAADTLGWILLGGEQGPPEAGQAATALDLLRQAAASLPADPSVQYHYAVALKDNGETQPAAAILAKLVAQPATFDEQPLARKLLDAMPHT